MLYVFDTETLNILNGGSFHDYAVADVVPNAKITLYQPPNDMWEYPLEGRVETVSEDGFTFLPYDQRKKVYGEALRFTFNKPTEVTINCGDRDYEDEEYDETNEATVTPRPLSHLWECDEFPGISFYVRFNEQYPETLQEILPMLMEKGPTQLLSHIYYKGLFGVGKDMRHGFACLLGERDYAVYDAWENSPGMAEDRKYLSTYPLPEGNDFSYSSSYWWGRYAFDHGNKKEGYETMVKLVDGLFGHFWCNGAGEGLFLAARDLVRLTVDHDLYDAFKEAELEYLHCITHDKIPLWMVYAVYLEMDEQKKKTGSYAFAELAEYDPEEDCRICSSDPFRNLRHIIVDKALEKVRKASENGDRYAYSVLRFDGLI